MPDPADIGNAFVDQFTKPDVLQASPPIAPVHENPTDFQGDKALDAYSSHVGDLYEKRLGEVGLGEHAKTLRPQVEEAVRQRAQQHVLKTLTQRSLDSGEVGRGSLEYAARRVIPFSGLGMDVGNNIDAATAGKAIEERRTVGAQPYLTVAKQLAQQQHDSERGVAGRGFDFATQAPSAVAEWMLPGAMLGKAGAAGAKAGIAAAAGRSILTGLPLAPLRVGAATAQEMAGQPVMGEHGLEVQPGKSFPKAFANAVISDTIERGVFGAIDPAMGKVVNSHLARVGAFLAAGEVGQDTKKLLDAAPQGGAVYQYATAKNADERAKALSQMAGEGLGYGLVEAVLHLHGRYSKGSQPDPATVAKVGAEEYLKSALNKELANVQPPPANAQAASPAALPPDATAAGAAPHEAPAPTEGSQGAGGASLSPEDPGARQAAQVNGAQAAEGAGDQLAQPGGQAEPAPQVQGGADRATEPGENGAVAGDAGSTGPAAAPTVPGTRSGVLTADSLAADFRGVLDGLNNDPNRSASIAQFLEKAGSLNSSGLKDLLGKLGIAERPRNRQDALDKMRMVLENQAAMRGKVEEIQGGSGALDLYQNAAKLSDADYQVGLSKVEQELEGASKSQLKDLWQQMGMVGKASADAITDLIQKRRDAFIQTQLIKPKRPGIMDWEPPKAKQALPLEEMPKFDDTEAGRKAEAAWRAAHPEYGNEFNAGDNARPGAQVLPPRPQVYDPLEQAIKEMAAQHLAMGEEGAMASGFPGLAKFQDATWKYLVNTTGKIRDNLSQFAGHVVPATTHVDRESGEALTRYASAANFAREAAPNYIDRVMGEDATEADRRIAGAVITERRLRKIRDVLQAEGDVAGAAQVKTIIGVEDSPLKTEADYDRYLNSQKMQGILARYKEHFVPKMEDNFRRAQEMEPDDPIEARTQIEGEPVNLKFIREGEDAKAPVFFGQRQGNLKNTGLRRLGFSRQAKGNATGYDIDLGSIIENSLAKSEELAAKHDLFRIMEANGAGQRGKRGERIEINGEPAKEIPNVYQQKPIPINMGMEAINVPSKTSFYVDARAYDELRQALAVDQAPKFPVAAAAANLLNTSALASSVEAVYHSKNLLSFLFTKPGVRLGDFMGNLKDVWKNDPETRDRLAELSRIGAMKAEGLESGQSKYNPLKFMGKYLDFLQRSVRLTADDAFERLKRSGLVEDTETNKRDFINQLGQYNKRLQNKMLVLFRNSGLGPFATAGTNYYMQGLRSLTFNPGVKASSASAALRLRMEVLGKTAAVIGGATLANYALWGRADGDDDTPLGAIKVGEGDGKTQYFDLTSLTGFTRGLRETGLLSLAEGARKGDETAKPTDKAVDDIIHSAMHPFVGPIGQFAYTAATGKNTIGMQVAKEVSTAKTSKGILKAEALGKPPPGSSQKWENVKAALRNANPAIGVLGGYDRPNDEATPGEKAWKLLGPFGVKTKTHPKVYSKGTKRGQ